MPNTALFSLVLRGSTNASVFKDFIKQLLHYCGRWPEQKSVLVIDDTSFHHSEWIEQLCSEAAVKLVYLSPYPSDLNPTKEFFAELKAFMRRNQQSYEENPDQDFNNFPEWCVNVVSARGKSAEGHFRHSGLTWDEL